MSGDIIISKEARLGMNTLAFLYVVERVRPCFRKSEEEAMRRIYMPHDEGGMNFISLSEVCAEDFRAFCRAAVNAEEKSARLGRNEYDVWWNRLSEKLVQDPRFHA